MAIELFLHRAGGDVPHDDGAVVVARREAGAITRELERPQAGMPLEAPLLGERGRVEQHDVAAVGHGDDGAVGADFSADVCDVDGAHQFARATSRTESVPSDSAGVQERAVGAEPHPSADLSQ